jgi:exosortase
LYYLYVHREELLKNPPKPFIFGPFFRRSRLWVGSAMILIGLGALAAAFFIPTGSDNLVVDLGISALEAVGVVGLLVLALDWSLAITVFGIALYVYGIYPGQNDYVKDLGMVVTLFGIVLLMCGWEIMRIAWFPIVFLICGLPWPGLVYSWVAGPLQQLAANTAVVVLKVTGVNANSSGTKIIMYGTGLAPPRVLNVAEACAGMRSLMTFITVAAAIGFLSARALWQKITITASAVPIAIFCNVMRVSGQGLLDHYVSPKLSESFAHQFVGMIMLVPAFFLILLVGVLLDQLFIEEEDEPEKPASSNPTVPKKAAIVPQAITVGAPLVQPRAAAPAPPRAGVVSPKAPPVVRPKPAATVAPPPRPAAVMPPRPVVARPPVTRPPTPTPGGAKPPVPGPNKTPPSNKEGK